MSEPTYKIVRYFACQFRRHPVIERGLTLAQARAHCSGSETSSRTCKRGKMLIVSPSGEPWFDGYTEE